MVFLAKTQSYLRKERNFFLKKTKEQSWKRACHAGGISTV